MMNIEIKPLEFEPFNNDFWFGKCKDTGPITYCIYNYDNERIIASIGWIYTTERNEKYFEYSEKGFNDACKWIEEERINLIKSLGQMI